MANDKKSKKSNKIIPNPLRGFDEAIRKLQYINPFQGFEESIKILQMTNPLEGFDQAVKTLQFTNPLQGFEESIKALQMTNPLEGFDQAVKTLQFTNLLQGFEESIKILQLQDPLKEFGESMKNIHLDSIREFKESMNTLQPPISLMNLLSSVSHDKWLSESYGYSDLEFSGDGTISLGSYKITQGELQANINKIINRAIDDRNIPIEEAINSILDEITKLKETKLQTVIKYLLFPLIVGIALLLVKPLTDSYRIEKIGKEERKLIVKKTENLIKNSIIDKSELNEYRIVTANNLNVRKSGSRQSAIIGVLHIGDVVIILQKGHNWALVKWVDIESNTHLQGWVFTRYLKKIQ